MCKYTQIPHNSPQFINFFSKKLLTHMLITIQFTDYPRDNYFSYLVGEPIFVSQTLQSRPFAIEKVQQCRCIKLPTAKHQRADGNPLLCRRQKVREPSAIL